MNTPSAEFLLDALPAHMVRYLPEEQRHLLTRAAERAYSEHSRQTIRASFDQAPLVIFLLSGPEHVFEYCNQRCQALLGGRSILGMPIREALPELCRQPFGEGGPLIDRLDRVYASGTTGSTTEVAVRLTCQASSRSSAWFNVVCEPTRNLEGRVDGLLIYALEVTEHVLARLQVETLAAQADERASELAAVIEHMPGGIAVIDQIGRIRLINDAGRRIVGDDGNRTLQELTLEEYPRDATTGRPLRAEELPAARALLGESVLGFEFIVTRRDVRQDRWIRSSSVPLAGADGRPRGAIVVLSDVTTEQRLMRDLAASEARYRTLIDTATEGLWTIDARGNTLFVNQRMARLLGYTVDEMLNRPITCFMDAASAEASLQRLLHSTPADREARDLRLRRSDGSDLWALVSISPIFNDRGELAGALGMVSDITERKRAEAEIRRLNAMKDEFLAVAAHELRTPVATMMAFSQLALRQLNETSDSRVRRALELTVQQCNRMKHLINEMLDVSRIQAGSLELELRLLDLNQLVREVVERMCELSARHPLRLEPSERPLPMRGDPARLEQVLTNLISNAIKYSPEGGEIGIRVERHGSEARVAVIDQGVGIPSDAQPRIFERFFRVHTDQRIVIEGLGLGLTIARDIVRRHGGDIDVESQEGCGSTFIVRLPLEEP